MEPVVYVMDEVAGLPYGFDSELIVNIKETGYPSIDNILLNSRSKSNVIDLIDFIAERVNQAIDYDRKSTADFSYSYYTIKLATTSGFKEVNDLEQIDGFKFSEKVLGGGRGVCVDAGKIIRALLRHVLPDNYKVVPLRVNSDVEGEWHDVTLVYSSDGYVVVNSKGFQGDVKCVFNEFESPVKFISKLDSLAITGLAPASSNNKSLGEVINSSGDTKDLVDVQDNIYHDLIKKKKV